MRHMKAVVHARRDIGITVPTEMVFLGSAQGDQWSFCSRSGCLTVLKGGRSQEISLIRWLLPVISLLSMLGLAVATQRHLSVCFPGLSDRCQPTPSLCLDESTLTIFDVKVKVFGFGFCLSCLI